MVESESAGDLDLFGLSKQLQQAGWDVFASDLVGEVAARRERAPDRGVCTLVIDRSGRWRFRATHALAAAAGREEVRAGYPLRVQKETQQVLTVVGRIAAPTDLPGLLAELTHLALEETGVNAHCAEGTALWDEESNPQAEASKL